ncbi:MAG: hypothetical protein AUK55_11645 [Syntrophobacteraceae bacterium CG2_30_61_12]|nr:MAG: hypothetical protein AUK55_11645 [Syntrophobacteraceae bacterium CG2_30_61_12]
MFEQTSVATAIHKLYPDIKKFGIFIKVKKDRLVGARNYELTLEKDTRNAKINLNLDEVKQCMAGNRCSLITLELERFVRQFIDESYAVSAAG